MKSLFRSPASGTGLPEVVQGGTLTTRSGPGWSGCTAQGRRRDHSSDAFGALVGGDWAAFAVADGVGSLPRSPDASRAAVRAAMDWAASSYGAGCSHDIGTLIRSLDIEVAAALGVAGAGSGATTLAYALVDRGTALLLAVGDSEVLRVGPEGAAERLNELDHVPNRPNMLLAWVDGSTPFTFHELRSDLTGSQLCLVTDGVASALDYATIGEIVRTAPIADAARELVVAAQEAGATDDLTAIVLCRVGGDG